MALSAEMSEIACLAVKPMAQTLSPIAMRATPVTPLNVANVVTPRIANTASDLKFPLSIETGVLPVQPHDRPLQKPSMAPPLKAQAYLKRGQHSVLRR